MDFPVKIGIDFRDREAYAEQTAVSRENQSAVNNCFGSPEFQQEDVSYEHEGYLIRVHFNGNKTLTQCIRNLAERRIEG